jgi:hypothetical protein
MAGPLFERKNNTPGTATKIPAKRGVKKGHPPARGLILGRPHRNYQDRRGRRAAEAAILAFEAYMGSTCELISHVRALTGIPETTLRRWREMIGRDPEWRPWYTHRGEPLRIFTPIQELAMATFLTDNFIRPGLIFTDAHFQELATNTLFANHAAPGESLPSFQCSNGFIWAFKKRHSLTSRRIHYKRRPAVTEEQRQKCLRTIRELMSSVPHSRIVNCDETSWLLHPRGILTWARSGRCPFRPRSTGTRKIA